MTRAARAALAAVPGAAVLWGAGAWWWSTGIAGAAFSREVEEVPVDVVDGYYVGGGGVFIENTALALLIAIAALGVLVAALGAGLAARPVRRARLLLVSLAAVIAASVLAHAVAPLEADWPPLVVAGVLVATCALTARRAPAFRRPRASSRSRAGERRGGRPWRSRW